MHIENIIKIWVYLSGFIPLFGIPFLVLLGLFLLHNYLVKKKITKTEIIFILSYAFTLAGITVLPSTGTVTPEFSDEAILILLSPFPLFLFLLLMVAIMKIRGEILPKWFIFLFCGISLCLNFIETLLSYSNILFEASFISLASFLLLERVSSYLLEETIISEREGMPGPFGISNRFLIQARLRYTGLVPMQKSGYAMPKWLNIPRLSLPARQH